MLRETLLQHSSEREYDYVGNFKENRAPVMKGNKWGFVDRQNQLIVPLIYDTVDEFIGGYAQVVKKAESGTFKYIFVDQNGNELLEEEEDS